MFTAKTRFTFVTLAVVLTGCGSGYGSTAAPPPPANTVAATNAITFTPATLRVSAGDIVRFTFGSVAHNVFFAAQAGGPADNAGNNANGAGERGFSGARTPHHSGPNHPRTAGAA